MSDIENETLPGSGEQPQAVEAVEAKKPEEEKPAEPEEKEEKPEETRQEKKRNRTREHIDKLHARWNDPVALERRLQDLKAKQPQLADFQYDAQGYVQESIRHEREVWETERQAAEAREHVERINADFQAASLDFAQENPDYYQAISSIPPQFMPDELYFAIAGHERGPEIAYHIAQNDDALFQLASIRPELMGAAVERLAKRLEAPQRQAQAPAQNKPITQAPPPPRSVSARSVAETPPEKLTDDEWYRREIEREKAERRRT